MQVRVAEHHGMCFGVRDAVGLALELTQQGPLTILGDLVHNADVVGQLDDAGAVRVDRVENVATPAVLLTAHGVADRVRLQLRQAGKEVHDATCPLVTRAHLAVRKLVADGYFPLIIGQREHVEVRGLIGDLPDCFVFLDEAELSGLRDRFGDGTGARLGVAAQTTQPIERVRYLVERVKETFPRAEVRFVDTVCQPTKDRQEALRRLVAETEAIVVVGGPDSNNSRKLTELARSLGRPAYQVNSAADVRAEWFGDVQVVGLTAGTSTPDRVIAAVRARLEQL